VASVIGLFGSLRSVDRIVHFTQFQTGETQLILYSFFSMVMFGAIYYILPRMVGCEWLSSSMIRLHFLAAAYGGGLLVITLLISGLMTGSALADPAISFKQAMETSTLLMPGRIGGWILLGIGHLIFGMHFLLMLLRIGQPGGDPTLFAPIGEEEKH
jgi:cytochrome c oxidase cbb3-type subunit 1